MLDHLTAYRAALCADADWSDDTPGVRALLTQYRAAQCKLLVEPCGD